MDPAEPAQPETPDTPVAPDSLPPHPTLTEYFRQLGPVVGILILLSLSAPAIFGTFVLGYGAVSAFNANANYDDPASADYHPLAGDWSGEGLSLKIRVDDDLTPPVTGQASWNDIDLAFTLADRDLPASAQATSEQGATYDVTLAETDRGASVAIGSPGAQAPAFELTRQRSLVGELIDTAGIALAALIIALLFALFTGSALLPTYALSFASGVFFGPVWGSLVAMFGVTFGALVGYGWGILLARKRVMRVVEANPRVKLIRSAIVDRSLKDELVAVTLIRIPPNSPFALTNLIMSSLHVRFVPYFVGTLVGIAPRTLIAVFLGVGIGEIAEAKSAGGRLRIGISVAVGIAVFYFIYRLFSRWVKERLAQTAAQATANPEFRPDSA
ncbi:MAG: TVP38/TMEM64 family protein [Phycisphaerales bacterium]